MSWRLTGRANARNYWDFSPSSVQFEKRWKRSFAAFQAASEGSERADIIEERSDDRS